MNSQEKLLIEVEDYVTNYLVKYSSQFNYHNINHTKRVVENSLEIAKSEKLNDNDTFLLLISAWFHDIGYSVNVDNHEVESCKIASEFLSRQDISQNEIRIINEIIISTKINNKPKSHLAKILADADFMHLADDNYFEIAELIREELNNNNSINMVKKREFDTISLELFQKHQWFTSYAKQTLTEKKNRNHQQLIRRIEKRKKKNKKSVIRYSRGVDTMFKLTARNQINLSSIADNKSNILISLNGIIISLGIVTIVSKFRAQPEIILPTVIFLIFSLITIVLAILSTLPHISHGTFTKKDIENKNVNLLFFGNFYKMTLPEYEWAVKEMINDEEYLYSIMTKDQYSLGVVLANKYNLLRWAYYVFMSGIVVSVVSFLIVFLSI